MGLVGVRTALRKDHPAVFLCYDVHADGRKEQHASGEISSTKWFGLTELSAVDWVSETMQQLAVDGLTQRIVIRNQAGLTVRETRMPCTAPVWQKHFARGLHNDSQQPSPNTRRSQ